MKKLLWILVAGVMLCFCGCTPRYVESGGVRYEALSEEEEQAFVQQARLLVRALKKKLTLREHRYVAAQEPFMKIRYTGDRRGHAKVWWVFPHREVVVTFDGSFFTSGMISQIYTREIPPELIDYSKKNPSKTDKKIKR